jgi:hypothetical protein
MIAYTLMLGASSSFMSPFGYQTNLMVFNAGGLKPVDLIKIGAPLQVRTGKGELHKSYRGLTLQGTEPNGL